MKRFRFLRNPLATEIGTSVESFLRYLGGPASIFLEGLDNSRTRAIVTLLHGNEPSGAMALFRWLKSGRQPAVNTVCIVASVQAALTTPCFSHRMLPGERDLNRCFRPPFDDEQGRLAEEILEILRLHHPEAVVDMHNTSGTGPAFGVCTHMDRQHDALVSLFTRRMIVTRLNLGALMEISEHSYPTVTVEVGGRLDDCAHELAWSGLCEYLQRPQVLAGEVTEWGLELLRNPIRLELNPGIGLAYAEQADPAFPVVLRPDIEQLNFGVVQPDVPLGWVNGELRSLFWAQDASGRCAVSRLLRVAAGRLFPAAPLKLFMITTNAAIARSDCLFYAIEQNEAADVT
ncbi:succinylglutamate desuccinylase/aspartoacylase family protein [Haliea sp. E1-2-M8]|uniref:succinylglutamate desuccinylase/aspartoacylase domain-containing protein n=1 Tax=Haliea sp. E1-2-M8 TaxID=3064706 RepID=UPI002723AE53|nr:succinylglutamate desuccinylase/aspartoacylase family protein [Haliea sp. E1-2-M8]MDO8861235.1 succinylglutamate desuccinylase/aspartoacylase family protein [Haliea sp. E1-2-M8]